MINDQIVKLASVICLVFSSACYGQANIVDACKIIITDGLREYSIQTDSSSYLNSVHDKYCDASGTAKTEKFGFGLDTIIQAIPVKFSGNYGSTQEAMKNFCRNYSSVAAGRTSSTSYQETTVRRAYESFDQCVALAAQNVVVRHAVRSREAFDFYIAPGFSRPITINGLHTPGNVECFGIVPGANEVAKKIDKNTRVVLNNNTTLSLGCRRSGTSDSKGGTFYDEAVVTLFTDLTPNGNYSVFMPSDQKFSTDRASDFELRLVNLVAAEKAANEKILQEIRALKTELNTGNGPVVQPGGGNGASGVCAPGYFMIGNRFKIDNGGPHGIISNVHPVCKKLTN